ncbi:MAG: flagellar filament capping protein FliD, partial [Planctomycetota bacterium]
LEINSRGLKINARVNDNGDGLLVESTATDVESVVPLKIESLTGSAARDLNILGESSTVTGAVVDGSYERTIDVTVSDSLEDVVEKINDAGIPVSASILDTGSGAQPFHLNLTSTITGSDGELFIDTGGYDLGLTTLQSGQDAKVFFGSDDPQSAFLLTSTTNSISDAIPGVTIDLHKVSEEAVTITIDRDVDAIVEAVDAFVSAFNSVISTIDQYDFFDTETEQRGILLGSSETARTRQALLTTAQSAAEGIDTGLRFLGQIGITIGKDSELQFDEDRFREAYADDPDAVAELFTALDTTSSSVEEVAPGVTVLNETQSFTSRGFGEIFEDLADRFTDSIDGTLTLASNSFDTRIELLNSRIEDFDVRLESKRSRLEAQFTAMELALSRLQSQSSSLALLASNVGIAQG